MGVFRVHFMRNVLTQVPKQGQEMVASIIRTVFAQPDAEHVTGQLTEVVAMLQRSHPKVAQMLEDARDDVTAFATFPAAHSRQIWSTNPLERVNKEIKRRTDVVGVLPNPPRCSASPARSWSGSTTSGRRGRRGSGHPRDHRRIVELLHGVLGEVAAVGCVPNSLADITGVEKLHHPAGRDRGGSSRE